VKDYPRGEGLVVVPDRHAVFEHAVFARGSALVLAAVVFHIDVEDGL